LRWYKWIKYYYFKTNTTKECGELALKKNNLIDLKYVCSNTNNDKFWDNFTYKSILDELIKIINNNTKMDDALKEELNQKFNEQKGIYE